MARNLRERYEIWAGEGLKDLAVGTVACLGNSELGQDLLEHYAGGWRGRIVDPRLRTNIAGITLENPVMTGAGWDKTGKALLGLYALNFAGVELGTVLPLRQPGATQPRLWTIDRKHSVAINRFAFNSPGQDIVDENIQSALPFPGVMGISVGRNGATANEKAVEDHAAVIRKLGSYADYIALGISSINTSNLRLLQSKEALAELIMAAQEAMPQPVPLFIKIDAERTDQELHDMIETGVRHGLSGIIATNSYGGSDLKAKYGARWAKEPGGLSGADPQYRSLATKTIRFIYEEAGDLLTIIGVGGVDDHLSALDKIMAGASAVQVVTAMRPTWGRVAATINRGLLRRMDYDGVNSVREYIGATTKRGQLP